MIQNAQTQEQVSFGRMLHHIDWCLNYNKGEYKQQLPKDFQEISVAQALTYETPMAYLEDFAQILQLNTTGFEFKESLETYDAHSGNYYTKLVNDPKPYKIITTLAGAQVNPINWLQPFKDTCSALLSCYMADGNRNILTSGSVIEKLWLATDFMENYKAEKRVSALKS